MKKSSWISIIDVAAFALFILLISTGLVIRYVLPPGSGRLLTESMGRGAMSRSVSTLWGLTRHEWGSLHFWIAAAFLLVLAFHLFVHWKWILVSFKGDHARQTFLYAGIGVIALVGLLVLAIAPFVTPKVEQSRSELLEDRGIEVQEQGQKGHGGRRGSR